MKLLITGAEGFVGTHLINHFSKKDIELTASVFPGAKPRVPFPEKVQVKECDITDMKSAKSLFSEKFDCVYHFAGVSDASFAFSNPSKTFDINLQGTKNIVKTAYDSGSKSLVFASSGKVYGFHETKTEVDEEDSLFATYPYGKSKAGADQFCQEFSEQNDFPIIISRLSNVFGPQDFNSKRLIPGTIEKLLDNKKPVIYGNGQIKRNFLFIEDLLHFYSLALNKINLIKTPGVFNVSSDQKNIVEVVELIIDLMKKKVKIDFQPSVSTSYDENLFSIENAKKVLNWAPINTFEQGIQKTIDSYSKSKSK